MVDRDEEERSRWADFDDRLGRNAVEGEAADDDFRFSRVTVPLALDDTAGEDDVFKVKDREIVILELIGGVNGYDIVQGTNQIADPENGELRHALILPERIPGAERSR